MPPTKPQRDEGVSPVIGAIFVIAFSTVSVLVTLYWGLPLIDEMKAVSEYKGVGNQFTELQAQLQDLSSGAAVNTAKRWDPALSRGTVTIREGTQRWAIQTDEHLTNRVYLKDAMGDTGTFKLGFRAGMTNWNVTPTQDYLYVEAVRVAAGQEYPLTVYDETPAAMTRQGIATATGVWKSFSLKDSLGNDYSFNGQLTKLTVKKQRSALCLVDADLCSYEDVATIWLLDMGEVEYSLAAGKAPREVHALNGATLKGTTNDLYVANAPSAFTVNTGDASAPRFFARATEITGGGSYAGETQFRIVLTLRSTSLLASDERAFGVKVYFEETDEGDAWMDYLVDETNGYGFEDHRQGIDAYFPAIDPADSFVEHWVGTPFSFTFVHTRVQAGGS
ncbi:MAG TPA: hypothetical protein VNZ52_07045 [Candidatus Thermoplasmatota archaeon]|nr:hypothetical protein [Candidatus Thermoplasmatota archaeon]